MIVEVGVRFQILMLLCSFANHRLRTSGVSDTDFVRRPLPIIGGKGEKSPFWGWGVGWGKEGLRKHTIKAREGGERTGEVSPGSAIGIRERLRPRTNPKNREKGQ